MIKFCRRIFLFFLILIVLLGLSLIAISEFNSYELQNHMEITVDKWHETQSSTTAPVLPELFEAMSAYNLEIYKNGQQGLVDAWSYQAEVFDLAAYGATTDVVGTINIPSIDVELPLYLGASQKKLSKGFAQLSQTSMPIGGANTNCVVACHRGYRGAAYLREADKIEVGDFIYLKNYWQTLRYQVTEIKVILPAETDHILIRPGKDLLTLVTCTPYRIGSHRLLIIGERC